MTYEELKNLVQHHCTLYYDNSAPELSDVEFDQLYDTLLMVEKNQGWAAFDSPTNNVGGKAGKVTHPHKLYSLRKVYDAEEIDPHFNIATPKIDGTNLTLVYKRGKLVLALTRGNGETGDNVLHLAKHIKNVPNKIKTNYDMYIVNGECVTDNDVENFRNYVSGALGLKSAEEFKDRNILFIAHDVLNVDLSYTKRMSFLKHYNFLTVFDEQANDYPHDGVVYRIDDYHESQKLGYTSKYPKFAVALKARGEITAETTLQDVIWEIGRTGTVNPTGIVDPVVLDDAKITRVTLHNLSIILNNKLGLGDTIKIERAGGVIPKFIEVVKHSEHNIKINKEHAEKALNQKLIHNGPKLWVIDKDNINNTKAIEHFIKIMEIKGLGPASVKKTKITHPTELYAFEDWSILGANGEKIKEEISKSKNKPYNQVLAALGVPSVGRSTAKLITAKIPKFANLREIAYTDIKGIGASTIESILTWLDHNEQWVAELPLNLEETVSVTRLYDEKQVRKVCITGKLDMSRNELKDILETKGFKVTNTVTKDCSFLISGGDTTSSKYKQAVKYNTVILDYWTNQKSILKGEI